MRKPGQEPPSVNAGAVRGDNDVGNLDQLAGVGDNTASAAIHRASARKFETDVFTEPYPLSQKVAARLFFNHVILA